MPLLATVGVAAATHAPCDARRLCSNHQLPPAPQLYGGKEIMMRAHFGLPSVGAEDAAEASKWRKRSIQVAFEIPYFTVSGIQVRRPLGVGGRRRWVLGGEGAWAACMGGVVRWATAQWQRRFSPAVATPRLGPRVRIVPRRLLSCRGIVATASSHRKCAHAPPLLEAGALPQNFREERLLCAALGSLHYTGALRRRAGSPAGPAASGQKVGPQNLPLHPHPLTAPCSQAGDYSVRMSQ